MLMFDLDHTYGSAATTLAQELGGDADDPPVAAIVMEYRVVLEIIHYAGINQDLARVGAQYPDDQQLQELVAFLQRSMPDE